ncbi:MAG: protease modulator HflC, partial [Desulfobacteraceae bacterium]|nr:protease modulator HflC [Desulfobacteraceae bacterium]
ADAEATMIYAQAYNRDPDFYYFLKSLDVYKETMDENTSLVLSTDSDFLKYLRDYEINKK